MRGLLHESVPCLHLLSFSGAMAHVFMHLTGTSTLSYLLFRLGILRREPSEFKTILNCLSNDVPLPAASSPAPPQPLPPPSPASGGPPAGYISSPSPHSNASLHFFPSLGSNSGGKGGLGGANPPNIFSPGGVLKSEEAVHVSPLAATHRMR